MRWLSLGALICLLGILVAGCTDGAQAVSGAAAPVAEGASASAAPPAALPACAAATSVALPKLFPPSFPLPPGAVVTVAREQANGKLVIGAYIPGDLAGAVAFLDRELPRVGYTLHNSEAESGEAEADFEGHGVAGRWKVGAMNRCAGAVSLTVVLQH
jgi:hypothetical protein